MAAHVRKRIRAAFVTALTGLATTGGNVFEGAFYPIEENRTPGMRIYAQGEDVAIGSMGVSRLIERTVTVIVELCNKLDAGVDDEIDHCIKEIEIAIAGVQTLGGLSKWIQLRRIEREDDGDVAFPAVMSKLHFEVFYMTAFDTPDAAQ